MPALDLIASDLTYWAVSILVLIGLHGMIAKANLVKKLLAMNILQVAVIVFFVSLAAKTGATVPIVETPGHGEEDAAAEARPGDEASHGLEDHAREGKDGAAHAVSAEDHVNPLPHALMLTAIVVSVSSTGVGLALIVRIHRRYGTIEEPELLERLKE